MNCIFCKIAQKVIPSTIVYEDEHVVAFKDLSPQAPIHNLIIPRQHIATLNKVTVEETFLLGHMLQTAKNLASELELAENGYRLVMNCNVDGGQTVFHIHLHLLGGRQMTWPPG